MFALAVFVCVVARSGSACELIKPAIAFPTEARCEIAGALIAGAYAGHYRWVRVLHYEIECTPIAPSPRG